MRNTARCTTGHDRPESAVTIAGIRTILTKAQAELPTMLVWDPQPLFCDVERCQGLIQKKLMYADDDHRSIEGSRLVAAHFFPSLPMRTK